MKGTNQVVHGRVRTDSMTKLKLFVAILVLMTVMFGRANAITGCDMGRANSDELAPKNRTCFIECMLRLSGLLKHNGFVDVQKVVETLRANRTRVPYSSDTVDKIETALWRCPVRRHFSDDKCGYARDFMLCGSEEVVKEGLKATTLMEAIRHIYYNLPLERIAEPKQNQNGSYSYVTSVYSNSHPHVPRAGGGCKIRRASDDLIRDTFHQPVPKTHAGKCILECMLRLAELLKDNGLVDVDKMVEPLRENRTQEPYSSDTVDKIEKALNRCTNHRHLSEDKCETIGVFFQCGSEEVVKEGLNGTAVVDALTHIYSHLPDEIIVEPEHRRKGTFLFLDSKSES